MLYINTAFKIFPTTSLLLEYYDHKMYQNNKKKNILHQIGRELEYAKDLSTLDTLCKKNCFNLLLLFSIIASHAVKNGYKLTIKKLSFLL